VAFPNGIPPGLVDEYFNDSTGKGDHGAIDAAGPWNTGGSWKLVEAPAFKDMQAHTKAQTDDHSHGSHKGQQKAKGK
jgi:hypothetical protein